MKGGGGFREGIKCMRIKNEREHNRGRHKGRKSECFVFSW